jgi:hypothetical protein
LDDQVKLLVQAAIDIQKSNTKINDQIKQIQEQAKKLEIGVVIDTKTAKKAIADFEKQQKQSITNLNAQNKALGAGGSFQAYLNNIKPQALRENATAINEIATGFKNVKTQADLTKVNAQVTAFKGNMKSMGMEGRTVFGELTNSIKKFGQWLFVGTLLMKTVRGIKSIDDNVHQLDTAMTDLRKVTDETDATYSRFIDHAEASARRIGSTVSDLVESVADFARLGYTLEQAQKLSESTAIYSNVGDIDIAGATESMISTLKAFKIEANSAISVVDKFNEVKLLLAS